MRVGPRPATPEQVLDYLLTNVRINEDGCHIWASGFHTTGYPVVSWHRKQWFAGRLLMRLQGRLGVNSRKEVWTTCRDPRCLNPEHLRVGDVAARNKIDRQLGRSVGGLPRSMQMFRTWAGKAKLPVSERPNVERMRAEGKTLRQIAEVYGCTFQNVSHAIRRWNKTLGPYIEWRLAA